MEHTSLPWEVGYHATGNKRDGCLVYESKNKVHIAGLWASLRPVEECDANAEFIIRACNAHEDLLQAALCALADLEGLRDEGVFYYDGEGPKPPQVLIAIFF